jgi:hypothetical protein
MGGTKESEAAVARALSFLAHTRQKDGRWTFFTDAPKCSPGTPGSVPPVNSDYRFDVALTGLATLAFLASDHTPAKPGPYQETVAGAVAFLQRQQKPNGDLRGEGNMYSHGIATLALAEAAIMTGDPAIKDSALRGCRFIASARDTQSGGWRYRPGQSGDTSVLGWQIMALHSATYLGLELAPEIRAGTLAWLQHVSSGPLSMLAGYTGSSPRPAMTAQASFTRLLMGQQLTAPQQDEVCAYLEEERPFEDGDYYTWYYYSLAMMQMHNHAWEVWNPQIRDRLVASQKVAFGDGSWDPDDRYGHVGGRVYTTAMATLTLEVYYRYLPMYRSAPRDTAPDNSKR